MPPSPVPIAADWYVNNPVMTVQFDQTLHTDPTLNTGNWSARLNNQRQFITAASASGDTVTLSRSDDVPEAGPDVVSYSPPPFDVYAEPFSHAHAFADYPVDVHFP